MVLSIPVKVGSGIQPATVPTPDPPQTQPAGDLLVTLNFNGNLKAGEYHYLNFETVDTQGNARNQDIVAQSGYLCNLYVIDEKMTTFLRPDIISRSKLQFSVNFPKPGKYKVWFDFMYANQLQHLAYILDVK